MWDLFVDNSSSAVGNICGTWEPYFFGGISMYMQSAYMYMCVKVES